MLTKNDYICKQFNYKKTTNLDIMDVVKVQKGNHFDELMTTLKYFANAGIVTDLAIVSGSELFHLHHAIISCFSTYFELLTKSENVKYIFHADERKIVLEALLDYIYKGVATIPRKHEDCLILTANSFHIRGFGSANSHDVEHCSKNDQATIECPNHKLQLSEKIWDARQNPSKTDVIFVVNNKHKVFAHACILSACSTFLRRIFTEHCTEKRKPYVVALRKIEKDVLEFVLEFCYKGEVRIPFQDIECVYKVADLLGVDALCELLLSQKSANLTVIVPELEKRRHTTNIIRTSLKPAALADLLRYERMVDVYIFSKHKIFKAHSVILSIYSVFFKKLATFLNYNLKDVILLIENFNSNNIETLLEYMYIGEAKFEGNLEEFQAIMSEWLDLNILPVSSEVEPQMYTSLQPSNKHESKIDPAVCNETVLISKTESRRVVNDGKSKRDKEHKESSEKEELPNTVNTSRVLLKEKSIKIECDTTNEEKLQIPEETLYAVKGFSSDSYENVPENVREETENNCNRLRHADKFNASKLNSIPENFVHTKPEIKNIVEIGSAKQSPVKENSTMGERYVRKCPEEMSKKEKVKNKSYPRFLNKNVTIGNHMCSDTSVSQRSEKEDSEIDDPENLEPENRCSSNELHNFKKKNHSMAKIHKQRTFECQTCNSKFTARWEFKIHLLDHPEGNVRQCKHCLKEFNKPSELQNHLRLHTGARPMQCETCGMCFRSKNTLRKHEHTHITKKTSEFKCEVCKKTFSRKQYLEEHKRTHSGNKPYECDVCHKSFVGKTGLNHHKKIHKSADEKKCAVCDICGKSFTRHALWTHMKHHNKEQKCEFCSKCFATTTALKLHVDGAHLGRSSHHCNTCGKGFLHKVHLNRHLKVHEKGKCVAMFTCSQCPSKFKDESHLKAHVKRKHTEQSNVSQMCAICGKHFSNQSTLIYHQRVHFHERPHRCNLCGKTFAMPYQLRDHTKLHHNEEKLFPCTVCKKRCATQALLNRHLLTHRPTFAPKTKPPGSFTCNYCDKTFTSKVAVSNHSRIHNFSRPYQCNVCRKAFRYQDSLLKHLRLHSDNVCSDTTTAKELPCIYTIQVCRPSFAAMNSDAPEGQNYASEANSSTILNSTSLSDPLTDGSNVNMCVNITEKTSDDINLLQLKPMEETYLNLTILQTDEVGFPNTQSMDANSINIDKPSDINILPRRPYSITIDGNLCYNSALSTDGDITPSISLLPERTELEMSDMDVTIPSHVLLPVEHSTNMVELSQLAASLPSEQATQEFDSTQTKDFVL